MTSFSITKATFRCLRAAFIAVTAAGLMLSVTNANAACGGGGLRSGVAVRLPALPQGNGGVRQSATTSIVGLWHVTYKTDGELFYEAYDQWHSDGTEFENADLSPTEGNVCMGVWKKVDTRTVQLNHVGWSFDDSGVPNGTFTLNETNKVSTDGMIYRGTFDYKFFDINGVLQLEVTGNLKATRITAD